MARQGKKEYVSFRSVRLPVYPYQDKGRDYWRFAYPDDTVKGGWRYGTRSSRKAAREAAHAKAVEIANGLLDLSNLSDNDAQLCREFLKLNPTRDDLDRLRQWKQAHELPFSEAVALFEKELPKPLSRHHQGLMGTIRDFEKIAGDKMIAHLEKQDLVDYLEKQDVGGKRKNAIRASFVQLFNWAKREGYIEAPNGLTIADRLPRARLPKKAAIRYFSPDEMRIILREIDREFLPWAVICGFAPVRSEELRARGRQKPPLEWQSIKRDQGVIDLPAAVSKVKKRRIIPMSDTLAAWLDFLAPPKTGAILQRAPSVKETKRLGEILDRHFGREEGWPQNALRHTFLTYSSAVRKDLPAIAIEAGTSVQKLNDNYVEAAHKDQAEEFFSLIPSEVFRMRKSEQQKSP